MIDRKSCFFSFLSCIFVLCWNYLFIYLFILIVFFIIYDWLLFFVETWNYLFISLFWYWLSLFWYMVLLPIEWEMESNYTWSMDVVIYIHSYLTFNFFSFFFYFTHHRHIMFTISSSLFLYLSRYQLVFKYQSNIFFKKSGINTHFFLTLIHLLDEIYMILITLCEIYF